MRKKHTTHLVLLTALFSVTIYKHTLAVEVNDVVLVGNSIPIDIKKLVRNKDSWAKRDIEALAAAVTNEYHRLGYTTTYVEKVVVKKDGILEVHVRESRMLGISVSGIEGDDRKHIQELLLPETGEIYNRTVLAKRIELVKNRFDLANVRIRPVNYQDSPDVFLTVQVQKKRFGKFYGALGFDPIYGILPEIGYFIPRQRMSWDLYARAGFRESELKLAEGRVRYTHFAGKNKTAGYIFELAGGRKIETWETLDKEYTVLSATPAVGVGLYSDLIGGFLLKLNCFAKTTILNIDNYSENKQDGLDAGAEMHMEISDRYYLLEKDRSTSLAIKLYAGRSNIEDKGYMSTELDFHSIVLLAYWFRLVPRIHVFHTTSTRRFYWEYIYNYDLLGFPGNYSASSWKNTIGLDVEFMVSPDFIYLGPFVNSGYILDEKEEWKLKTGTGIKLRAVYRRSYLSIYYAWDAGQSPGKGGLFVSAEARF